MKSIVFVLCLLFSLPNLLAGFACAVLQRTFRTRNLFAIAFDFLDSVAWGLPIALLALTLLLIAGVIVRSRPYAALLAIVLNLAALALVFARIGVPPGLSNATVFVPVTLTLVGCTFIAVHDRRQRVGRP